MTALVAIVLLVLVAFAIGCLAMRGDLASNPTPSTRSSSGTDATIDPADDHQVALLMTMTGGAVTDASVARAALQRFETEHGRRATTADLGTLLGMIRAMRS